MATKLKPLKVDYGWLVQLNMDARHDKLPNVLPAEWLAESGDVEYTLHPEGKAGDHVYTCKVEPGWHKLDVLRKTYRGIQSTLWPPSCYRLVPPSVFGLQADTDEPVMVVHNGEEFYVPSLQSYVPFTRDEFFALPEVN